MPGIRVAVIGAGGISSQHCPVLVALDEIDLVAVTEPRVDRLSTALAKFGVPNGFASIDELLEWGEFDAAWVLVSHVATAEVAERFIRLGVPTFVEKPPGIYPEQTECLVRAVEETATVTQVGLNRRFYTSTRAALAALLDTGGICSVNVEAHEDIRKVWRDPRLTDEVRRRRVFSNSIHALDHLRIIGGEIAMVEGRFARFTNRMPDAYTGYIEFASGAIGRALVDHFGDKGEGHRVEARTSTATLVSHDGFARYTLTRQDGSVAEFGFTGDDRKFKPGFPGQAREFAAAVREGRQPEPPAATIWDGLATMRLIEAITCSGDWPEDQDPVDDGTVRVSGL